MDEQPRRFYETGPFLMDPYNRVLARGGEPVPLPPKAFDTLLALIERPGTVVAKEQLLKIVWPDTFVEENNLNQYISLLRGALGDSARLQQYIETVPKLGYRFVAPVREVFSVNGDLLLTRYPRSPSGVEGTQETGEPALDAVREEPACPAALPSPDKSADPAPQRHFRFRVASVLAGVAALTVLAWGILRPSRILTAGNLVQLTQGISAGQLFLCTDGSRIYYTTGDGGSRSVGHLSVAGGESLLVPSAVKSPNVWALSRKRQELLVQEGVGTTVDHPLWIQPLPAGSPRRLGNLSAHDATYSPDEEQIAYAIGNRIYVARKDGSGSRKICDGGVWPRHLRWSPDGRVIRFKAFDQNRDALWEVSAASSEPRLLLSGADFEGDWTPDGQYFIYTHLENGRRDLWALRERPSLIAGKRVEPIHLTNGPVNFLAAALSPDGKKLYALGESEWGELARYDAKTGVFRKYLGGISADSLAFSRDGRWVAYSAFPDRTLWVSRADGLLRQQLTFAPLEAILPSWSPDGTRIAFMGHTPGKPWKIYIVPAKGGAPAPLTAGEQDEGNPAWSPDGQSLVFAGVPWVRGFDPASTAIHVMNMKTGAVSLLPGSEGRWSPRWSPDGRYLVTEIADSKALQFYDFHVESWRAPVQVTDLAIGYTGWSRDSRFVYFNAWSSAGNAIYRLGVAGQGPELVLNLGNVSLASSLGQWFTLAPDGSQLVLRDLTSKNIYSLDLQYR